MSNENTDLGQLGEDFLIQYFRHIGRSAFKNHDPQDPVNDIFVEGINGVQVKTQAPFFTKSGITLKADAFLKYKEFRAKIIAITYPLKSEKYQKPSHLNLTNRVLLIDPNLCEWEPSVSVNENSVYKKVVVPIWKGGGWATGVNLIVEDVNIVAKEIGFRYKDYLKYDLTTAMMNLSNYKGN